MSLCAFDKPYLFTPKPPDSEDYHHQLSALVHSSNPHAYLFQDELASPISDDFSAGSPPCLSNFASPYDPQDLGLSQFSFDFPLFSSTGPEQVNAYETVAGARSTTMDVMPRTIAEQQQQHLQQLSPSMQPGQPSATDLLDQLTSSHGEFVGSLDSWSSSISSPMLRKSPSPSSSDDLQQLAAVFVREYARTHDLSDIDVLVRALTVAGIEVSHHVLAGILEGQHSLSEGSVGAPTPTSCPSVAPEEAPVPALPSPPTIAEATVHDHVVEQQPKVVPPPATKVRSSAHTTARHAVAGPKGLASKRFVCEVCDKSFDRAFNLKTHMDTHAQHREKPFVCPHDGCSKPFARKHDMNRHFKSVHLKNEASISLSTPPRNDDTDLG